MILNSKHSLWQLGFRPTFLLGTFYAAFVVLVWVCFYSGALNYHGTLNVIAWHIHEMVIGFISIIIFGFLLTATQNWTGMRGVHGIKLQLLIGIWLMGRIFSFLPLSSFILVSLDILYLAYASFLLYPYLKSKSQNRNKIFLVVNLGFIITATLLCLYSLINNYLSLRQVGALAVGLVLLVISVIAGRVVPFFTKSAVPNAQPTKKLALEWACHIMSLLPFVFLNLTSNSHSLIFIFALAGLIHFYRWILWKPWQTVSKPILLILHISYVWLAFGFLILSIGVLYPVLFSLGLHAITIGLIGSIIIAMVSRVSLGHTGRPLIATKLMITSYILIQTTAITRLGLGATDYLNYMTSVKISGTLWVSAFLLLFISLIPLLTKIRVDGRPG